MHLSFRSCILAPPGGSVSADGFGKPMTIGRQAAVYAGKALVLLASRVRRARRSVTGVIAGGHQRGQAGFMTERQRAARPAIAVRTALAGLIIAGGALALAGQAGADPTAPYPTPRRRTRVRPPRLPASPWRNLRTYR